MADPGIPEPHAKSEHRPARRFTIEATVRLRGPVTGPRRSGPDTFRKPSNRT